MIQLIYTSYTPQLMDQTELDALLETSRKNNSESGITGILLYKQLLFLQVLEGEEDEVMQTFKRIAEDPRHQDVELVQTVDVQDRDFSNWEMAFRHIDNNTLEDKAACSNQMAAISEVIEPIKNKQTRDYLNGFIGLFYS